MHHQAQNRNQKDGDGKASTRSSFSQMNTKQSVQHQPLKSPCTLSIPNKARKTTSLIISMCNYRSLRRSFPSLYLCLLTVRSQLHSVLQRTSGYQLIPRKYVGLHLSLAHFNLRSSYLLLRANTTHHHPRPLRSNPPRSHGISRIFLIHPLFELRRKITLWRFLGLLGVPKRVPVPM